MLNDTELFAKRKLIPEKLLSYGFHKTQSGYVYTTVLPQSQFELTISVASNGELSTAVTDTVLNEEYTLHRVEGATGAFVGAVRKAYEAALTDVAQKCSDKDVFKSANAQAVIAYIKEKYGDEPEYLWEKFPDNAIFRIGANKKWYAALLRVSGVKMGLPTPAMTDILDLKAEPERLGSLVDGEGYLPGYHMNKKHWYTIPLEGAVALSEIRARIDDSYEITVKQR